MSSTLAPKIRSAANPIQASDVVESLEKLGLEPKKDLDGYASLLTGIWEVWDKIDKMDDYVPLVDEERFPRVAIHRPQGNENPWNAWAWRATVMGSDAEGGKLSGKTICLKDNVCLKGVPCLLGTEVISDWKPNTDATIVTRILEAGGEIKGKAVCENLSLWGVSSSSASGHLDNVYAPGYSAGGSSSGTGVLVSRGEVDMGIGGDQGGSIRMPASKNGLVGMKPTTGLVPYTGIVSLEPTLDHTGPMTRNVLDNALFLEVLAGADGIDDRQQAGCPFTGDVPQYSQIAETGIEGLRVGIISESLDRPMADARVSALVVKAARQFEKLGATVSDVSVPMHALAPELWAVIGRLSAATSMTGKACGRRQLCLNDLTDQMFPLTQNSFEKMFPSAVNTLVNGIYGWEKMPPSLFGKATNLTRRLKDTYDAIFGDFDVLITPTIPMLPQRLPTINASAEEHMLNSAGLTANTSAFNLTGHPALSLPVGFLSPSEDSSTKLPVGMQIIGRWYDEATIYRAAYAWENKYDWRSFV